MPTEQKSGLSDGFLLHRHGDHLRLLLPAPLANRLEYEGSEEYHRHQAEELERDKQAALEKAEKQVENALAVETPTIDDESTDASVMHEVYTVDELRKLEARVAQVTDGDQKNILRRLHGAFKKRGVRRRVTWPTQMEALEDLRTSCPNFSEVIDIVRDELLAAKVASRAPMYPPLLLTSGPGVGKTHFCQMLGKTLGSPHYKLCFDSAITSSALGGVDPQWGTAKAGLLLEAICGGDFANPLFVLDEIDKANRSHNDDPLAPLHTLLERSSAKSFRDIFANFEFDASLVAWIATANDADLIPSTLRSRFTEIVIHPATAEQAISQAIVIAREVVDVEAPIGFEHADRRICVALAHLTPREIKKALSAALRHAIGNGRMALQRRDFPRGVFDEHSESESTWLH